MYLDKSQNLIIKLWNYFYARLTWFLFKTFECLACFVCFDKITEGQSQKEVMIQMGNSESSCPLNSWSICFRTALYLSVLLILDTTRFRDGIFWTFLELKVLMKTTLWDELVSIKNHIRKQCSINWPSEN